MNLLNLFSLVKKKLGKTDFLFLHFTPSTPQPMQDYMSSSFAQRSLPEEDKWTGQDSGFTGGQDSGPWTQGDEQLFQEEDASDSNRSEMQSRT